MSDLQIVVSGAKTIERVLVDELGGSGRGLYETMSSSRTPIPQALQRRIRYVATMRNKSVHELRFELGDAAAFTERCARIVEDLRQLHADRQLIRTDDAAMPVSSSTKPWVWGVGAVAVLALLVGGYLVLGPRGEPTQSAYVETATRSTPLPQADQKSVPPAEPAAVVNGAPSATAAAAGDGGSNTGGNAAAAAPTASAGYYGSAKEELRIEGASLRFQGNAAAGQEAIIEVSVRNVTATTLSHALLDVRLYINGEAEPELINGKRKGAKAGPLHADFGIAGLAIGEIRIIRIPAAADSNWNAPDILKARSRRLVVTATQVAPEPDVVTPPPAKPRR